MPFAQFHYPFEGEQRSFDERFRPSSSAGDRPDAGVVLLAARGLDAAVRHLSYRHCVCLGLILDPEGQKMSKSRGNVVEPGDVIDRHGADALRWYYLTSQQPWAGYRFSVETVGEAVRQFMLTLWNTYAFWVLYANAEGLEKDFAESAVGSRESAGAEALDRWVVSGSGDGAGGDRRARGSVRAGQAIAAYVDVLSNWYVRPDSGASGRATGRRSTPAPLPDRRRRPGGAVRAVPRRRDLPQPRRGEGESGSAPDSVHLVDPEPETASRTRTSNWGWKPRGAQSSWGGRLEPRLGSRCASRCPRR